MLSLSQKALRGVIWALVEKYGGRTIQFFAALFLYRLLIPQDYGLIAVIAVFFALANVLVDSGFSQALIREKEITIEDRCTTFYVNLILAICIYTTLWFSAPLISNFFDHLELTNLTRFMGMSIILYSLSIIQRAYFIHKLNFRTQAYINIIGTFISSLIAVVLAYNGFGVWALASQYIALSLISTFLFWLVHPWFPKQFITRNSFNKLFRFGSKLMLSGVINISFMHAYKIIIGKVYATTVLGYYDQANNLKNIVSENFVSAMVKVFYPTLSKMKEDEDKLKKAYVKIMKATSYIIFPCLAGLGLVAEPFVLTIAGPKWVGAILVLQILVFGGAIFHLHVINLDLLKIMSRTDLILRLEIYKKIGVVVAIFVGLKFGFHGLIIAQVVSSYLSLAINMTYTSKLINYSKIQQFKDILVSFSLSIPMILIVYLSSWINLELMTFKLLVMILIGICIYSLTSFILKPEPFKDIINIFTPRLPFLSKINI